MAKSLLIRAMDRALSQTGLTRKELAYKVLPSFFLDLITRYLRVKVKGLHNLPNKGPCIVIANHSGFMGFDALVLGHQIYKFSRRAPHIIAHKLWFIRPEISVHAEKLGLVPATFQNGLEILKQKETLLLFPEGEEGNFKPSSYRYRLRRFRRGFVRLALATGVPIVPATVVGAEETHITLSQIKWAKQVLGIVIPVPLNVLPLPAKWEIQFGKPIHLEKDLERLEDLAQITRLSREIRLTLQKQLHSQLKRRRRVYL